MTDDGQTYFGRGLPPGRERKPKMLLLEIIGLVAELVTVERDRIVSYRIWLRLRKTSLSSDKIVGHCFQKRGVYGLIVVRMRRDVFLLVLVVDRVVIVYRVFLDRDVFLFVVFEKPCGQLKISFRRVSVFGR